MNIKANAQQIFRNLQAQKGRPGATQAGGDKVSLSSASQGEAYIIMPPKGSSLFKSEVNAKEQVESVGAEIQEDLKSVNGYVATLSPKQVEDLEKRGFRLVPDKEQQFIAPDLDGLFAEEEDEASESPEKKKPSKPVEPWTPRPQMTAPRFDGEMTRKYTGKDVTIAVLDSGIHPHPDFDGRLLGQVDFVQGLPMAYDDNGHGTHVASCAAGDGLMSEGVHKGIASQANLIGVKVLGAEGNGRNSGIIKGLEWCIENKDALNIKVINLSLGGPSSKDWENDPINQAVKAAYEAGIVVLAAAGNEGPGRKTVGSPGNSPHAITIGAADDRETPDPADDTMADFSSRGPTKDGRTKPDLVAPGEHIFAALAPGTEKMYGGMKRGVLHKAIKGLESLPFETLKNLPDETFAAMGFSGKTIKNLKEDANTSRAELNRLLTATTATELSENLAYQALPGTSMATPIVAGLVAAMFEANPKLSPDQVREILTTTADKLPGRWGANSQGAGMVDPAEALTVAEKTEGKIDDFLAAHAPKEEPAPPEAETQPAPPTEKAA